MLKSLIILPLLLLVGCGGKTATITIQSTSMPSDNNQVAAVRKSARKMYQLMLAGDAKAFCSFLAPSSIQDLHSKFPRSGMSSRQICLLISNAALNQYLKDPANRQAIESSLKGLGSSAIEVDGNYASMGSNRHHTRFEKVAGTWRPMMPQFGLGSGNSLDDSSSQVTV